MQFLPGVLIGTNTKTVFVPIVQQKDISLLKRKPGCDSRWEFNGTKSLKDFVRVAHSEERPASNREVVGA